MMDKRPAPGSRLSASTRATFSFQDNAYFAGAALDALPVHVAVLDLEGNILAFNKAWSEFAFGNASPGTNAYHGWNYLEVCDNAIGHCSDEAAMAASGIRKIIARDCELFTLEYPCHTPTDQSWFYMRAAAFEDHDRRHIVVSHENITERKLAELAVQRAAETDLLTGLANRTVMLSRIAAAAERYAADPEDLFAVYFLDFDRFKLINDSLGHDAGDDLLKQIASRLTQAQQPSALGHVASDTEVAVARFGGDEFVVLVEHFTDSSQVEAVGDYLMTTLSVAYEIGNQDVVSTASIGIATPDTGGSRAEELIRNADIAMYAAKDGGKARYVRFDKSMHDQVANRLALESDLHKCLDRDELFLVYQPIIALESGAVVAFEALVRWQHPRIGLIPPIDFISIAEESGTIVPIGYWIMQTACRQLRAWQHLFKNDKLRMNVNLSRRQLLQNDLPEEMARLTADMKLPRGTVVCEVTENAIQLDFNSARKSLESLREAGFLVVADDFGTGHSSLGNLHNLPLDSLKIDRSLINDLSDRRDYAAVIHAVITLARNLNMSVTAEGVENAAQLAALQALDCDQAQGYFFSKPMPVNDATAFLAAHP